MNIDFNRAMDKQVIHAFKNLVNQSSSSMFRGVLAMILNRWHEKTIEELFRNSLSSLSGKESTLPDNQTEESYGKRHDILGKY